MLWPWIHRGLICWDPEATAMAPKLRVRVASSRRADVITIHADRPIETTTIAVDGLPPVTASPSYPNAAGERTWPYELRFYDPPPNGFTVTLRLRGSVPAVVRQ